MDLKKIKEILSEKIISRNLKVFGDIPLGKTFKLIPEITYQFHLPGEDLTKFLYWKTGIDEAEIL